MNTTTNAAAAIHEILTNPDDGVVGVVDNLVAACHEQMIEIDWQGDHCRVKSGNGHWEEFHAPIKKSAFRAVLARIASLCNESAPNSVTPYGGHGRLPIGAHPACNVRIVFTNTTAEQMLRLKIDCADSCTLNGQGSRAR
jgi:hypothetical protein